jgi:hypothetical protein
MSEHLPENDTPTPQDVWAHELTFHSEGVMTVEKASGDYYLLTLPYKIEKFGWQTGDDYLMLEKVDDEPPHIRIEKASEEYDSHTRVSSRKAVYKLVTRGSKRPRIRIPKMWADEFLNYGGDESLSVELNEIEEEPYIRIYDGEDVQQRKMSLIRSGRPVKDGPSRASAPLIPLVETDDEEYVDLSSETDLQGQRFNIVPFYSEHDEFFETAKQEAIQRIEYQTTAESLKEHRQEKIRASEVIEARRSTFNKVKAEYGIPVTSVDELAISWCRNCMRENNANLIGYGYKPPEPPAPDVEDQIIYREANTDCVRVELPAEGSFFVIVKKDGETSRFPIFHRSKPRDNSYVDCEYERHWGIMLKDDTEMPPTIYIPVHLGGKVKWTKYG